MTIKELKELLEDLEEMQEFQVKIDCGDEIYFLHSDVYFLHNWKEIYFSVCK